jgi:ATP-binding cassette subfamily F protein 3
MREALVFALQDYQGAMVIVSHDRHLLRTTVDEFYLVANQQVQPFAGDLDDYHDWLKQHVTQPLVSATTATNSTPSRKDEKREAAQRRQALKPLKDALQQAEQAMIKYQQALALVTEQLGDNAIYSSERKADLSQLLSQQAHLQQQLQQAESAWLEAAETLQHAEAD